MPAATQGQLLVIQEDLRNVNTSLHKIDTNLALVSQRMDQLAEMQGTLKELQGSHTEQDRTLVEIAGRDGESGKILELEKGVARNAASASKVADKVKSLILSRAFMAGWALAGSAGAAGLVKYLM